MNKKLNLNKITIAALDRADMRNQKGGYTLPEQTTCNDTLLYSCPQTGCCSPTHNPEYSPCNTMDSVFQCPLVPGQ